MHNEDWFDAAWSSPVKRRVLLPAFSEPLEELEAEKRREDRRDRRYLRSREHRRLHQDGDKV